MKFFFRCLFITVKATFERKRERLYGDFLARDSRFSDLVLVVASKAPYCSRGGGRRKMKA
jgi:hypothetical protein